MGRQNIGCARLGPQVMMATLKLFGSLHADDDPY
jgi:hypothetical protein